MKELIKKVNVIIIIKSIIVILIFLIFIYTLVFAYSNTFEQDKIKIDKYNFEQLEKVKNIIEIDKKYNIIFLDIKEFNSIYKSDIKPIYNCYFISKYNGNEKFIFGFQLESLIYKFIYFGKNYAYPSYDLPRKNVCYGKNIDGLFGDCDYNIYKSGFIKTISNPCRD